MLKRIVEKGFFKDLGNVLQVFKDNKGRFSSKRTVAGVVVGIALTDIANGNDISWEHLLLCAISASIVIFSPMVEKHTKDEYPVEK